MLMKKLSVIAIAALALMACQKEQKFEYTVDKFYDLEILRYQVPGFDELTLKQKTMLYYLSEAAANGRDIIYDQNCRYNLTIRHALEHVYRYYPNQTEEEFKLLEKYLKRVWFSNGIHHHYSEDPENRSYSDIIDILKENKLIKRKLFCKLFVKYRGFDDEEYLSGNYYLNRKMGVEGMLKDLMVAPVTADTITLSFPEGWTIQQIVEKLEKNEVCDSARLYAAIKSSTYDKYKFISDITDNKSRYLKLEGYLFPDTYDFYVGADANYVIKKFLDNFDKKWEDGYDARAEKLGCTRDQIITIASIIQKEAADADQMKLISSIIHNRLKDSANYPTLGCDSTAIYISNYVTPVVGENQGKLLYDFYDTSAVKGLPPGPICNPGMDAIKAALYPEDTNYYFFAHDKSGNIYTASTLNEHRNNLVKIIQANNKNR